MSEKEIFMVYRKGGDLPREVHDNFNEAMTEAQRLANLPVSIKCGATFHVMQAINVIKSPEPVVIEVGDIVTYGESPEMLVTFVKETRASIIKEDTVTLPSYGVPCKDLKLIRKGPKVHTFEGVTAQMTKCESVPTFFDSDGMNLPKRFLGEANTFVKTYTIDIKEESDE